LKNIIYASSIPSPFQLELVNECSEILKHKGYNLIPLFLRNLPPSRSHWDVKGNPIILENKNISLSNYIKSVDPFFVVLTNYKGKEFTRTIFWLNLNRKKFFLGPMEVLRYDNKSFLKRTIRDFYFKYVSRYALGIATMGKYASIHYGQLFKGPILDSPYTFDMSRLKTFNIKKTVEADIVFLISGGLIPVRNPLLSLNVFNRLIELFPKKKLKLVISGKGPLRAEIANYIKANSLEPFIEWKVDFQNWEEIHSIYKNADILLALQDYGGWGLVVQEAMASGMVVVATKDLQSANSLILHGYNGLLVRKEIEEIVSELTQLINEPDHLSLLKKRSRDISKTVDLKHISTKLTNFWIAQINKE